ncbi:UNVERIFIED_ORG: hypothetical protein GGI63_000026 [Rhizobium esperanzae]
MRHQDLAADQPVASPADCLGYNGLDQPELQIGRGCRFLHHRQGLHKCRKILECDARDIEIFRRPQRMDPYQCIGRQLPLPQKIGLNAQFCHRFLLLRRHSARKGLIEIADQIAGRL